MTIPSFTISLGVWIIPTLYTLWWIWQAWKPMAQRGVVEILFGAAELIILLVIGLCLWVIYLLLYIFFGIV